MRSLLLALTLITLAISGCRAATPTAFPAPDPTATDDVSDPLLEPKPNTEPVWTVGRYFPQFPSTDRVYVFRLPLPVSDHQHGAINPGWRINQSEVVMMNLTLTGMQGIINRYKPSVYIEWYDPLHLELTDFTWTQVMEEHVEVVRVELDSAGAIDFLMQRYASWFSGIVLYDPNVPDTINLATMIAGLEDRIMLAPEQLGIPGMAEFKTVTDLRDLVQDQGWDASEESKHQIYQWVYENLWPNLDHRIIGVVSPGPPTSREMIPNSGKYYQVDVTPRDYLIALRLSALWLSPDDEPDASLFHRFLDDAPSPVPLTGVFARYEHLTVKIASEHGGFMTGLNWPGGWITTGGMSVLSGIQSVPMKYEVEIDQSRILETIGADHIVTLTSSDGDAIYYCIGRGFGPRFGWDYVQDQRFGWTISPLLAEMAPMLWNYFVETRSDVRLTAGVSGVGYAFPEFMDNAQLNQYLDYSSTYLKETGIRTLAIPAKFQFNSWILSRYYEKLKDSSYLGAFTGWQFSQHNLSFTYPGAPAPAVWSRYPPMNDDNLVEIVDAILSQDNQAYADFPIGGIGRGTPVEDPDAIGGEAVLIPREFVNTADPTAILVHSIGLLPGDYLVSVSLKVADNRDHSRLATLVLLDIDANQILASRDISPSDFLFANTYQTFGIPLSLAQPIANIEFRIQYSGGQTDLYADFIKTDQSEESNFPVFVAVGIDNIGIAEARAPEHFISEFENRGGIVLYPEEFMAALNPEYMIELATSLLGEDHNSIVEAQTQFDTGEYFISLMIIRNALENYLEQIGGN